MKPVIVSPSILSADFSKLADEVKRVQNAGAEWIHVDVMDGHFVPNITIGAPVVASLRKATTAFIDVHLMIENPEKYIEDFAKAGSDLITFHIESTIYPEKVISQIRSLGKKVGITLRPPTPINDILPFVKDVDLVLIMTVNPGFSGQSFLSDQLEKISYVSEEIKKKNLQTLIQVDGGVNEVTGELCYKRGASVFVAGNYVFKNDYEKAIKTLLGFSQQ